MEALTEKKEKREKKEREEKKNKREYIEDHYDKLINSRVEAILDDGRIIRGILLGTSRFSLLIDEEINGRNRLVVVNKAFLKLLVKLS
jgi:small nuclear ribonucleoprotein (snRNP)-like protein